MSSTCQPVAVETVVMAYSGVLLIVPEVEASFWAMVTANVIDAGPGGSGGSGPNELIESIVGVPVATCLSALLVVLIPDVSKSLTSVAASCGVVRPASFPA
jgi:hypothetical protein